VRIAVTGLECLLSSWITLKNEKLSLTVMGICFKCD